MYENTTVEVVVSGNARGVLQCSWGGVDYVVYRGCCLVWRVEIAKTTRGLAEAVLAPGWAHMHAILSRGIDAAAEKKRQADEARASIVAQGQAEQARRAAMTPSQRAADDAVGWMWDEDLHG